MTVEDARELLDDVRNGKRDASAVEIRYALMRTGDLMSTWAKPTRRVDVRGYLPPFGPETHRRRGVAE